jgi:hypothetical protein
MMAGLRWDRQYQDTRWWNIGAFHLASDVYPYTRGWPDKRTARLNAQPGDILVKPGYGRDHPGHVALLAELTVRDCIDPNNTSTGSSDLGTHNRCFGIL